MTALLAGATFYVGRQGRESTKLAKLELELIREQAELTRQHAEAATKHAEAAERQATVAVQTLEELQSERNLSWRPRLVMRQEAVPPPTLERPSGTPVPSAAPIELRIANVGRGPAVSVFHAYTGRGEWWFTRKPTDIGPQDDVELRSEQARRGTILA